MPSYYIIQQPKRGAESSSNEKCYNAIAKNMPENNFEQSDRPRVPLRPPIRGQEQPIPRPERPSVGYHEPDTKAFVPVFHPEITGMAGRITSALPQEARVDVRLTDQILNVQFRDYLAMTGVSYADDSLIMKSCADSIRWQSRNA